MGCFNSKGYDNDIPQHATARSDNKHLIGSHDTDAWGPPVPLRSASTHKSGQLLLQEQQKRSISTTTIGNKVKKITTTTPASIQRSKSRSEVPAATNPKPRQAAPNAAIIDGEDQQEEAGNKPAVGFVPKVKTTHNRSSKSGILYQNTPYSKTHADGIPALSELDLDVDDDALLLPIGSSPFDLQTNGSRQLRVLAGSFDLHYSVLTQRGYYPEALEKANQDSFCVRPEFGGDPSTHFFGVFDGHGEFGAHCSQFVKKHLCENLLKDPHYPSDVVQAYHSSFLATNAQLHRYNKVDDSMSGTTAITVLVRGRKIYVANVGDSRAVLAVRRGKKLIAKDISSDQTPYRADECARVKLSGARVMTLDQLEGLKDPNVQCWGGEGHDDGDPPRLWVANGMYPGTAFTRSIGDSVAEQIGVSAVPEVLVVELRRKHSFFVIASDGVFEFLSSQAVVDMVARYKNPKDACAAVVAEAYRLWLQYETRTDDITIIVVHIDGLKDIKAEKLQSTDMDPQQFMQIVPYDASPLVNGVELPKKQRPARMLSRARLRAIEASLDHDTPWVPSDPHAKTPGEEAHIERAMQGNFLFQSLTEDQRHTLCGCMKRMDVCAGDIIIKQGSEGDLFYIVESGDFEVLVSQDGAKGDKDLGAVVHQYDATMSPCFGELALMYTKPGQATVRAVTDGSLWTLEREAFRGVLLMRFSNRPSLKFLHSLEILSKLSLSQLHCLANAVTKVPFTDGETIVEKDEKLDMFYMVQKGHVKITYHSNAKELSQKEMSLPRGKSERLVKKATSGRGAEDAEEGEHAVRCFGEWVLLDMPPQAITAVASGDVECWAISREAFEGAVGPLSVFSKGEKRHKEKTSTLKKKQLVDARAFRKITLKDLDWQETVYLTDCCEVGVVLCKNTEEFVSMKRFQRKKVQRLGRESQVLLERFIIRRLQPSPFVPHLLATLSDDDSVALVLNCVLAGPLALLLHCPLDEVSARYMAASVVLAIELLHKDGVAYRGISPDVLMVDRKGRLQLVDFRFAKEMSNERTFTICGMADFLAPEIIKGQGHSLAADWWAVGVLLFFMLQNELPFGSWRDNELDIFAKIARRQLVFPSSLSGKVVDLIDKLLVVDESKRLGCGSQGVDEIKDHPWFNGVDWDALLDCRVEPPLEICTRLENALRFEHTSDSPQVLNSQQEDTANTLWLDGW